MLEAAASPAARASSWVGGDTGSAGRGGMPENTSGNPNRLNRRRTCASSDGGCGSAASSVRTTAEPLISLATAGNGPFTRFSARNQIASRDATTATADPATESAFPNFDDARSRARTPTNHPAALPSAATTSRTSTAIPARAFGPSTTPPMSGASRAPATSPMSSPPNPKACSVKPRR